jgi:cytochrome oxidase Cu insertion factor (SCO1/SenC/PrrC family)
MQVTRLRIVLAALTALGGVAFATAFAVAVTHMRGQPGSQLQRPTGIPANISTNLAALLQLSPVPPAKAPPFTLTDQYGRTFSLADARGKAVVLTFMDPHCTDICPIVSREFIVAHRELGADAAKVVFVAVNVNQFHLGVADVAAWSRDQQLDTIGSWYFLTGPLPALRAVWNQYNVTVIPRGRNRDVVHSGVVYFIDPRGRERYVSISMADHTAKGAAFLPPGMLSGFARGIALVARDVSG